VTSTHVPGAQPPVPEQGAPPAPDALELAVALAAPPVPVVLAVLVVVTVLALVVVPAALVELAVPAAAPVPCAPAPVEDAAGPVVVAPPRPGPALPLLPHAAASSGATSRGSVSRTEEPESKVRMRGP
jgi:hypothetical protein